MKQIPCKEGDSGRPEREESDECRIVTGDI